MGEERKSYEERMIEVSQSDSNKKHCMDQAIDMAEYADWDITRLSDAIKAALCDDPDWRRLCVDALAKTEYKCAFSAIGDA